MDNFTKRAKKAIEIFAQFEAKRLNSDSIGPEHLFLSLLKDEDSIAARILRNLELKFDLLRRGLEQSIKKSSVTIILGNIPVNIRFNRIIELARTEASNIMINYIGTEHLLIALFKDASCTVISDLKKIGIDYNAIKNEVLRINDFLNDGIYFILNGRILCF